MIAPLQSRRRPRIVQRTHGSAVGLGDRGLRCDRWIVASCHLPDPGSRRAMGHQDIWSGNGAGWICVECAADHAGHPLREIGRVVVRSHQGHDGAAHGCGACKVPSTTADRFPSLSWAICQPSAAMIKIQRPLFQFPASPAPRRQVRCIVRVARTVVRRLRHVELPVRHVRRTRSGAPCVLRQRPQRHLTEMIGQPVGDQGIGLSGVAHLVGEPAPRNASACLPDSLPLASRADAGLPLQPFHRGSIQYDGRQTRRVAHPAKAGRRRHPYRWRRWRLRPYPGAALRPENRCIDGWPGGPPKDSANRLAVQIGRQRATAVSGVKLAALAPKVRARALHSGRRAVSLPRRRFAGNLARS